DGVSRYWIEFVPENIVQTDDGKAPLVVFFHGSNQGAETYLANSEGFKLAQARGFIAIYLTGAMPTCQSNLHGRPMTQMPNPMWNLQRDPEMFDDYAYVRAAIEDVVSRLPVDTTRVYATGLSFGSRATQCFTSAMSDVFAASAPMSSFMNDMNLEVARKNLEGVESKIPMFFLIGATENGSEYLSENMRNYYGIWLEQNGLGSDFDAALSGFYKDGKYNTWTFEDANGVPLVQYANMDGR
ncbi:MAG: PHB depolymerase family esterase, partial [Clostridia bacterium]|nr:PHB depolymerase family esterase [Clostridia bacterium]